MLRSFFAVSALSVPVGGEFVGNKGGGEFSSLAGSWNAGLPGETGGAAGGIASEGCDSTMGASGIASQPK